MTVLSQNISRDAALANLAGFLALKSGADPYLGSGIIRASDGYVRECAAADAGLPFEGFCALQVETRFAPTADGGSSVAGGADVKVDRGYFLAELPLTGVAIDDVFHRRAVFMTDDATFAFTEGTYVGNVVGVARSNVAIVACFSHGFKPLSEVSVGGIKTLAATGAQTLTTADLGKLILIPNTAAYAVTLPLAADSTGRGFTFKKTSADAAIITLTGAGAEVIDAANTNTAIDAAHDMISIISDGTAWRIVSRLIA
jgi:hypothetical protein